MASGPDHQLGQVIVATPKAARMSRYFPGVLPVLDSCPGLHTYPSMPPGAKVLGLSHPEDPQPGSLAVMKNEVNKTLLICARQGSVSRRLAALRRSDNILGLTLSSRTPHLD